MRDKILEKLIKKEILRQNETLNLIASENIVSENILSVLGSPLTNKYSEGYPSKRYYGGNKIIDEIEFLAQDRARKVFGLNNDWHINVQPYSGSPANIAIYCALLNLGEKIMGMSLYSGGHLTHGWPVNFSGKFYKTVQYGVKKDGFIDYDEVYKLAKKERPKIIVAGATAYPRILNFKKFSEIANEVGAYFLADISHIAGLIIAGIHPSPFLDEKNHFLADVVMTTTHKTLRGPRGAIIFVNRKSKIAGHYGIDIAKEIDRAIFPLLQGGPHNHQTAAIAAALYEAGRPAFKKYGRQIVKNARALAFELKKFGFNLISGGTDNHLILIDLSSLGISGKEAQEKLESNNIIVNRNIIPYDKRPPFDPSGIRLGTPALTSRGMKEKEMTLIAQIIFDVLCKNKNCRRAVKKLCQRFPIKTKIL